MTMYANIEALSPRRQQTALRLREIRERLVSRGEPPFATTIAKEAGIRRETVGRYLAYIDPITEAARTRITPRYVNKLLGMLTTLRNTVAGLRTELRKANDRIAELEAEVADFRHEARQSDALDASLIREMIERTLSFDP